MKRLFRFMTYLLFFTLATTTLVYATDNNHARQPKKPTQVTQSKSKVPVVPLPTTPPVKPKVIPPSYTTYGQVTAHYLNVREAPSNKSHIRDVLVQHYVVKVKPAKGKPSWYALQGGGYVSRKYVKPVAADKGQRLLDQQNRKPKPKPVFPKQTKAVKKPAPTKNITATPKATTGQPSLALVGRSNISAQQFDALLSKTNLAGIGSSLVAVEQQYSINGLFTLAVARLESANGSSRIARDKNNLFGMNAVDGNAYNAAYHYASKHDSIMDFGSRMRKNYINKGYTTLASINKKYSSSNEWQHKVHSIMSSDLRRASY